MSDEIQDLFDEGGHKLKIKKGNIFLAHKGSANEIVSIDKELKSQIKKFNFDTTNHRDFRTFVAKNPMLNPIQKDLILLMQQDANLKKQSQNFNNFKNPSLRKISL